MEDEARRLKDKCRKGSISSLNTANSSKTLAQSVI